MKFAHLKGKTWEKCCYFCAPAPDLCPFGVPEISVKSAMQSGLSVQSTAASYLEGNKGTQRKEDAQMLW